MKLDNSLLIGKTLRAVLTDPGAPAAAKVQAARTLAEMDGLLGRHQSEPVKSTQPAADMSPAEIERELQAIDAALAADSAGDVPDEPF